MLQNFKHSLNQFANQEFKTFNELIYARDILVKEIKVLSHNMETFSFWLSYIFTYKAAQLNSVSEAIELCKGDLGFPVLDLPRLKNYLKWMLSLKLPEDLKSQLENVEQNFAEFHHPTNYKSLNSSEFQAICEKANKLSEKYSDDYTNMMIGLRSIDKEFKQCGSADPYLSTKLFIALLYYSYATLSDDHYLYGGFIGYESDTRAFYLIYAQNLLNFYLCSDPVDLIYHNFFCSLMAALNSPIPEAERLDGVTQFMRCHKSFQNLPKESLELNFQLWNRVLSYFCATQNPKLSHEQIYEDFYNDCLEYGLKPELVSTGLPALNFYLDKNYFFDFSFLSEIGIDN
ncbi:MAG: hypothetical protein K2Q18_13455 [Bdellovibrionales bacterium]|nr:hypothetical protein [Bdellovibrionales bacterium]